MHRYAIDSNLKLDQEGTIRSACRTLNVLLTVQVGAGERLDRNMPFSLHEAYSKCLFGAHLGQPLWTPQLKTQLRESYQLEGLKIGDVGVVSSINGSFDVLFNITLPRNEQPYPKLVGEDFTPIILDPEADFSTQDDSVCSWCYLKRIRGTDISRNS
ncbi:hypothetical protein L210DRAFT_2296734 [Boletus edulis BED1]|uniref:Uncharacterized protein n=1 Tax=Boletus edulis BED1 TaxID=1328754 RepID=A0AAD4BQY2_BOLED|nr:hypothetical protein L210DRAFT_2296734 [Boletus edulis BED1]